jgi:hypothetical protein
MSRKGRYGCLYLNLSGSQFSLPKSLDCHILPEVSHVHAGQQEIIILMSDFVARIAVMALLAFPATSGNCDKENKGAMSSELPLHYIHGDNRYRRQTEETKVEYFPISQEWHVFIVWYCRPILTLLSHLLWHACQATVLLFFIPLLGPDITRAGLRVHRATWC